MGTSDKINMNIIDVLRKQSLKPYNYVFEFEFYKYPNLVKSKCFWFNSVRLTISPFNYNIIP